MQGQFDIFDDLQQKALKARAIEAKVKHRKIIPSQVVSAAPPPYRHCAVQKTGKNVALCINSDYAHLFA